MTSGSVSDATTIATDVPERSCGGCTACCEGWLWDKSMNLHAGSACPNITAAGCGIYETRPEKPCRVFKCAWLTEPEDFPDDMRPDKSGAILVTDRDWFAWKVLRAFPCGPTVPSETLQWLVHYAKPKAMPVIFYEHGLEDGQYRGMSEKALGPPAFAEEVRRRPQESDVFTGLTTE